MRPSFLERLLKRISRKKNEGIKGSSSESFSLQEEYLHFNLCSTSPLESEIQPVTGGGGDDWQ
jgi:hypothetical protein